MEAGGSGGGRGGGGGTRFPPSIPPGVGPLSLWTNHNKGYSLSLYSLCTTSHLTEAIVYCGFGVNAIAQGVQSTKSLNRQ